LGDYYNPQNVQFGQLATTTDLLNLYATGDIRGPATMFRQVTVNSIPLNFTRKYQGMNDSANNIKIIRLSEVYLNRAEAYAETNNLIAALSDLNAIRRRANPAATNFASTDKQVVLDEILTERRRELAFEGHTFFDLARKKKNLVRADCTGVNCSFNYPNPKYATPKPINQ
jgi:starch-binding outer membrane protein, SusD/RagB family